MEANLVMQLKNKAPKTIAVPSEVTVIGRQRNCDLRIPLDSISRRHCEVHCNTQGVVLRDLGSRNGTFLNGAKISNKEQVLHPGDRIQIGPITFVLQINGQPARESANTQPQTPQKSPSDTDFAVEEDDLGDNQLKEGLDDSGDLDMIDLDGLDDLDDLDLDDL
jgi:pSer/pThr/pTyr-binding forkhead associated (FHA) protein